VALVETANEIELPALPGERVGGILDVLDQLADVGVLRVDVGALVRAGQERRPPTIG